MARTTVLQLHKRSSGSFENIEDRFAISSDSCTIALADGTTQSFNSKVWARAITESFVEAPSIEATVLLQRFSDCAEKHRTKEVVFSKNPALASLERTKLSGGATATFLGVHLVDNSLKLIACGDSNCFLIDEKGEIVASFPHRNIESLDNNNFFLNSESLLTRKVNSSYFEVTELKRNNCRVLLATDALSRMILNDPSVVVQLLNIQNFEELHRFCLDKWESGTLEEDDISAIIFDGSTNDTVQFIHPSPDFRFADPKKIYRSPMTNDLTNSKTTPNEKMANNDKEILQNQMAIKSALKLQIVLLLVLAFLEGLNLLMSYQFLSKEKVAAEPKKSTSKHKETNKSPK